MAQHATDNIEMMPDSPVAREDLGAGGTSRGAGARSPLFWKVLLLSVAVVWGYSFTTMKDALDTIPVFELLYVRFLPAALVMFSSSTSASSRTSTPATLSSDLAWAHLCGPPTPCRQSVWRTPRRARMFFDGHVLHRCAVRELFSERRKTHPL